MSYDFKSMKPGRRLTYFGYNNNGHLTAYDAMVESIDMEGDTLVILVDDPELPDDASPEDCLIKLNRRVVDCRILIDPLFGKPRRSNKLTPEPSYLYALVFMRDGTECGRAETTDYVFAERLAAVLLPTLPDGVYTAVRRRRVDLSHSAVWLEGWE